MNIERINFERTGGFAGIRIAAEIEIDELPEDKKGEILALFDKMNFDELPEKLSGKMPIPDEFVYSITIESDGNEHRIFSGESSLPDEMQPLLEILTGLAKKQMRKNS